MFATSVYLMKNNMIFEETDDDYILLVTILV